MSTTSPFLSRLRWQDCFITNQHKDKYLKITGKGNKIRAVPVGLNLSKLLLEYRKQRTSMEGEIAESQSVLSRKPGPSKGIRKSQRGDGPISSHSIQFKWRVALKKAGIRHINAHSARHRFAIHWLETNGDLGGLRKLLGHANISTTSVYLEHLDMKKVHRRLAKLQDEGEF